MSLGKRRSHTLDTSKVCYPPPKHNTTVSFFFPYVMPKDKNVGIPLSMALLLIKV